MPYKEKGRNTDGSCRKTLIIVESEPQVGKLQPTTSLIRHKLRMVFPCSKDWKTTKKNMQQRLNVTPKA